MKKRRTEEPQYHDDLPHWNALVEKVRQQLREQEQTGDKHRQDTKPC